MTSYRKLKKVSPDVLWIFIRYRSYQKAICSISSTCCGVVIPILENSKLTLETIGIVGWVRLSRPVKPYRSGEKITFYITAIDDVLCLLKL